MIIETALAVGFGSTFIQAWKASDLNEKALNTLQKAYGTHADAVVLFQRHKEDADKRLNKLIKRKKAVLVNRMGKFLEVYQQIRKIDFQPGDGILELYSNSLSITQVKEIETMAITAKNPMTEKETVARYLFSGIGNVMMAESKRNVEIANSQNSIAKTLYSQSETMVIAIDAIGERADQISALISQLSLLFGESINSTEEVISKNGTDRQRYSKSDREILMNCVNLASAVKAILDVPVLNADGSVTEASLLAIEEGRKRLLEIQDRMKG